MPDPIIEPKTGVQPVEPPPEAMPAEGAETVDGGETLPEELIKDPIIQALTAGSPPAVSSKIAEFEKTPEAKLLKKHQDVLTSAGFGMYRSLSGDIGVLFNQNYIPGEAIQQADKAGQLLQVAPPAATVKEAIEKSGENHPALSAQGSAGPATPPQSIPGPPVEPAANPVPGISSGIQRQIMGARTKNLQPQSPTQGVSPGGGKLLRSILKPVL
jgi:hypothetical protein